MSRYEAETFEAREDLICDYCEKIISPNEGSVNWPDSGLIVCDDCFDDAIKNGTPIDIVSLVNQHNEWQQLLV